ncbi:hypothetical protein F511_32410 [Dorcoceras hygrometricum]|uniref:Uncharacterized protein n=1 Tax=Dorcoceras hygrometricum TaxID=472368 RepID=A0A2Z7BW63_9LAMI|nr:hypothetical protein F511_32410 [Dorcoceras hygrometricum]
MGSLKGDVLLKLLEDMKMEDNESEDDRKPVLLQIRSIIPVLEEGDLWPNRGFFLKVSDLSHALYVSLPQEQNEMILGNKLKLGQFIYVRKLENAHPVPLLRGVTPVPGRRRCEGTPEDIVSPENLVNILEASGMDSIVEKGHRSRCGSLSPSRKYRGEIRMDKCSTRTLDYGYDNGDEGTKSRPTSVDNDSDTDSVVSYASSTSISKRRSWMESEILGVKDIYDSSAAKQIRPPARSRSANVSPVRSIRYDSSDENFSSVSRRRSDVGSAKGLIKRTNKNQISVPKVNNVQIPNSLCSFVYDRKGAETGILWNYLPSTLVKLGKEVIKQRDIAMLAAADALQEACAADKLLRSLSMFSELTLAEGEDLQPFVDKFFELQDDLARTRLILQSLTNISPLRTIESGDITASSIKEVLSIALERKRRAATWIKSAVAMDLSLAASVVDPLANPMSSTVKNSSISSQSKKPKVTDVVKKSTSYPSVPLLFASERDDQNEWTKGSTLTAANGLATSLQDGSRKLFLNDVEEYLDEVERKCSSMDRENSIAGMMYRVKKVSDWLDLMVNKEGNHRKDGGRLSYDNLEDSEIEICGRLRNKIYGILMKHIERMAFKTNNHMLYKSKIDCAARFVNVHKS